MDKVLRSSVMEVSLVFFTFLYLVIRFLKKLSSAKSRQFVGSVVEWLKRQARDQHGPGSKPIRTILLCFWERHFATLSLLGGLGKQF